MIAVSKMMLSLTIKGSFAALVLNEETQPQALSQALHLSGLCALMEVRHTSFFSDRQAILVHSSCSEYIFMIRRMQ